MTPAQDPIGCREAVAHLWDMLDGQIAAVDRQAVDRHLAWCLRCCGELTFARELRRMLQERSVVRMPDAVRHRLEGLVHELTGATDEVSG